MSVKTILSDIGHAVLKIFEIGDKAAIAATPTVTALFPGIGALFTTVTGGVALAELAAVNAGKQTGSGPAKLVVASAQAAPAIEDWARQNGYQIPDQNAINTIISGAVSILNAFQPASTVAQPEVAQVAAATGAAVVSK